MAHLAFLRKLREDGGFDYDLILLDKNRKTVHKDIDEDFKTLQKSGWEMMYAYPSEMGKLEYETIAKERDKEKLIGDVLDYMNIVTHAIKLVSDHLERADEASNINPVVEELLMLIKDENRPLSAEETAKEVSRILMSHESPALDDNFISSFYRKMARFCEKNNLYGATEFFLEKYAENISGDRLQEKTRNRNL